MRNARKRVWKWFSYRECDAMKEYLEQMAEKGWYLKELGAWMVFEQGIPGKLRYAVHVFAKGSEYDTVKGLDSGADDYIPKPFRMMELVSRVKALLRRAGHTEEVEQDYVLGCLTVSRQKHQVKVDGEEIILTLKEFEMLLLLISNPEIVFTRAQLLDKIWGYQFDGESRTVDVHIRTLRQKLGKAGQFIETVRGMGYKIGGTS